MTNTNEKELKPNGLDYRQQLRWEINNLEPGGNVPFHEFGRIGFRQAIKMVLDLIDSLPTSPVQEQEQFLTLETLRHINEAIKAGGVVTNPDVEATAKRLALRVQEQPEPAQEATPPAVGGDWEKELSPSELDAIIREADLEIDRYGRDLFQDPEGKFIEYSDLSYIIPAAVRRALSQAKAVDVEKIVRRVVEAVKEQEIHHCDNRDKMEQELHRIITALQAGESTDTEETNV